MTSSAMTRPEHQDALRPFADNYTDISIRWQTTIATALFLVIVYYVWPWLTYETTIKRRLYDIGTALIPGQFGSILQSTASKITSLPSTTNAQNVPNQAYPLQQQPSGLSSLAQRARRLSGFDKLVPPIDGTTFAGLGNWDNSCFQNSVLQGLASLDAYGQFVQSCLDMCGRAGTDAPTLVGLSNFLAELQQERHARKTIWPPSVLRSMNTWQQQDAQEYYSKIMDAVEKETLRYQKAMTRRLGPSLGCLRQESSSEIYKIMMADAMPSEQRQLPSHLLPFNPMDGTLSQTLRCQRCGFSEGISLMAFNCLTLNLGLSGNCYLEDLLDSYTEAELIEGVECDECTRIASGQVPENATSDKEDVGESQGPDQKMRKEPKVLSTKAKRILFGRLPRDLVIHLNRSIFDDWGNQRKNTSMVTFPSRLEIIDDWTVSLEEARRRCHAVYELRCIVTHQGRHDNGHYVACGKRGKEWFVFNDEIVTRVPEEQVLSRGHVFMLFYEQVDRGPWLEVSSGLSTPPESLPATCQNGAQPAVIAQQETAEVVGEPRPTHDVTQTSRAHPT